MRLGYVLNKVYDREGDFIEDYIRGPTLFRICMFPRDGGAGEIVKRDFGTVEAATVAAQMMINEEYPDYKVFRVPLTSQEKKNADVR